MSLTDIFNSILSKLENEKKNKYNRRIMEVEHGTFTPLIFTTTGVMGSECTKFYKALAMRISEKKDETYSEVVRYLRVKLSFMALKSALLCLRGSWTMKKDANSATSDFGLALEELGL